jgi:hypothetical protein
MKNEFNDSFKDDSWKRHLDFDNPTTISVEIQEELALEKEFGESARKLIGVFFRRMDDGFKRRFNPYRNKKQALAAKRMVKMLGSFEAAETKAREMMIEYSLDPVHCPRILMPTQMLEKFDQYEEYVRNKGKFKKLKTTITNNKPIE